MPETVIVASLSPAIKLRVLLPNAVVSAVSAVRLTVTLLRYADRSVDAILKYESLPWTNAISVFSLSTGKRGGEGCGSPGARQRPARPQIAVDGA